VIRHLKSAIATIGDVLQRLDSVLRTWAIAGMLLLTLALVLAAVTLLQR
jgi:hypothetical protein